MSLELKALDDAITKILADYCTPDRIAAAEGSIDRELWRVLDTAGLLAVGVPEHAGGSGGSLTEVTVLIRRAGEYAAAVPLAESGLLGGWLLAAAGLGLPAGILTVGQGEVVAKRQDGGWYLSGTLRRVAYARHADAVAGVARTLDGPCAFAIPVPEAAVAPGENLAREPRDTVTFDVTVPPERAAPIGAATADELVSRGALARALMVAGAARRALALTSEYASVRRQFGRPIASFQAVQHHVATLACEAAASHAAAEAAVRACEAGFGRPAARHAIAAAKVRTAQAAGIVSALAHQVHGAIGMTQEHALRLTTSRLWAWRDEWGSEDLWAEELARSALASTSELWPVIAAQ
jgi:acyl-CoA dehydrogenase